MSRRIPPDLKYEVRFLEDGISRDLVTQSSAQIMVRFEGPLTKPGENAYVNVGVWSDGDGRLRDEWSFCPVDLRQAAHFFLGLADELEGKKVEHRAQTGPIRRRVDL